MSDMTLPQNVLGRTGLPIKAGRRRDGGAVSRIWGGRSMRTPRQSRSERRSRQRHQLHRHGERLRRSEEYIGRFLSHRRDEFLLATKCGCTVVRRDETTDDTPHVDLRTYGLHESLARMRIDYVDVCSCTTRASSSARMETWSRPCRR